MKALEKDRARRYQSVHDFRHDIERYLGNQTISARPPSAWYRARKFAQRHRTRMVTAGVAIAVLLMAVVAGALQRSQLQANAL
ncbi:MAG TPA: hypothetical protein DCY13_18405, partial [Verrucomicrobiales bacterium]|nr:hypothetical protein [Verrucomicrobiales bacterium]